MPHDAPITIYQLNFVRPVDQDLQQVMVFQDSLEVEFLGELDPQRGLCSPRTGNPYGKLFALLREAHQVGDWHVDLATGRSTWSDETFNIHGVEPREGHVPVEVGIGRYEPCDAEAVRKLVAATADTGQGFRFRLRLRSADGSIKLVESIGSAIRDKKGKITELMGLFFDVSEEQRARLKAEHYNEVVKTFSKDLPVSLMVLNPDLDVLQASDYAIHEFGMSRKTLLKNNFAKLFPDLPSEIHKAIQCAFKGKKKRVRDTPTSCEKDASWYNWTVLPWMDINKDVVGVVVAMQSKPVKSQPLPAKHVVHQHHGRILENAPTSLLSIDPKTRRFDYANRAACHLLGIDHEQILDNLCAELILSEAVVDQLEQDLAVTSFAGPYEAELHCGSLGKRLCTITGSVADRKEDRRLVVQLSLANVQAVQPATQSAERRGFLAELFS